LGELLTHLDSKDADPSRTLEDLRLLRFDAESQLVSATRMYLPPRGPGSHAEFIQALKAQDSAVHHQVVLIQSETEVPSLNVTNHSSVPRHWIVEALGFALDVGPDFWLSLISKRKPRMKAAWTDAISFLDVSGDILLLLDEIAGIRPKTGMHHHHYHQTSPSCHLSAAFPGYLQPGSGIGGQGVRVIWYSTYMLTTGRPREAIIFLGLSRHGHTTGGANLLGSARPSQCTTGAEPPRCTRIMAAKIDALESWISAHGDLLPGCGASNVNFLFVCVEALLRFQMYETPINVPHFVSLDRPLEPKYKDDSPIPVDASEEGSRFLADPTTTSQRTARLFWERLHNEVHHRRETLLQLFDFVDEHFDFQEDGFKKVYDKIQGLYERHVQWLELHKTRLKDIIDMESSQKANTMAELSIAESKRMMSCECFLGYLNTLPLFLITPFCPNLAFYRQPVA
jgi:hypothetical protein